MKEILKKLLRVQKQLVVKKDQYNDFGGYNYRSAEQIIEKVKPLLFDEGLILTITDEPSYIEGRFYIASTAFLVDVETEERISCTAFAREQENVKGQISAQITGATASFAKKYALCNLFAIDNGERDFDDNKYNEVKKEQDRVLTEQEQTALRLTLDNQNVNIPKLLQMLNRQSFEELTISDAEYIGELADKSRKGGK